MPEARVVDLEACSEAVKVIGEAVEARGVLQDVTAARELNFGLTRLSMFIERRIRRIGKVAPTERLNPTKLPPPAPRPGHSRIGKWSFSGA